MVIETAVGVWLGLAGWALTARLARAALAYWRAAAWYFRAQRHWGQGHSWRAIHEWAAPRAHQEWVR